MTIPSVSTKKYAVTYRNFRLDPKVDGVPSSISSEDVTALAEKNYWAAVSFLKRISSQDRVQLLKGMRKKIFAKRSISIHEEVSLQLLKPPIPFNFQVVNYRNCSSQPRVMLTDASKKIHLERFCDSLVFPLNLDGDILKSYEGDPELALVQENFTGSNCASYILKDLLRKLVLTDEQSGQTFTGLVWQEIFVETIFSTSSEL